MSIFEPNEAQIFALEENERLQRESRSIEYEIAYRSRKGRTDSELKARLQDTGITFAELSQRLRENLEKIKALNTRELCKNLVPRR